MILYSPAKINIGLQVVERRGDGFHNLQSVMYPTGLFDIIEIRKEVDGAQGFRFTQTGIGTVTSDENNLCARAWELFSRHAPLPPVELHLHKQIPVGAGLGGGSSNAAVTLRGLNSIAADPLSEEQLHEMAARLGSDCPFFLHNAPMMVEGRGEMLSTVPLDLGHFCLVLLFPEIHISTAEAYARVSPSLPSIHLRDLLRTPPEKWRGLIINDFERSVFERYPELELLKHDLYREGAIYASMSGSGSALYGLFRELPDLSDRLNKYVIWKGKAKQEAGIN